MANSTAFERCPTIGVLAAVDPDDRLTHVDADVIRRQLGDRLGRCAFIFRSTHDSATPLRHTAWTSARPTGWTTEVDVVIVDQRINPGDRLRAGVSPTMLAIDTALWCVATPLASLFTATADPAALDTRRRMLDHLGLTHLALIDEHLAVSAIDLSILAERGHLDLDDPRVVALVAGQTAGSDELLQIFHNLATSIGAEIDGVSGSGSTELVRQLDDERRDRFLDQRRAVERLDEAQREVDRLRRKVENLELRATLTDDADTARTP